MKKHSSARSTRPSRTKTRLTEKEMAREDARDAAVVARRLKRKERVIRFSSDEALHKHFGA